MTTAITRYMLMRVWPDISWNEGEIITDEDFRPFIYDGMDAAVTAAGNLNNTEVGRVADDALVVIREARLRKASDYNTGFEES